MLIVRMRNDAIAAPRRTAHKVGNLSLESMASRRSMLSGEAGSCEPLDHSEPTLAPLMLYIYTVCLLAIRLQEERHVKESKMIRGSCCCGAIKFQLSAAPSMMGTCHCSRCRKVGASTLVFVRKETFHWIEGREFVVRYEPEPPFQYARCFCRQCGTALGEVDSPQDSFPVAANCLDDDPVVRNQFHEFMSSKPAWYEVCDTAKQFEGHPLKS